MGVLYVVDSVTRQWVDQARKSGQQVGPGATDGTFAAGVNRVTELLPSLMTDIINTAPDDQKVCPSCCAESCTILARRACVATANVQIILTSVLVAQG